MQRINLFVNDNILAAAILIICHTIECLFSRSRVVGQKLCLRWLHDDAAIYLSFWLRPFLAAARRRPASSAASAAAARASGRARADSEGVIRTGGAGSAACIAAATASSPAAAVMSFLNIMACRSSSARSDASWAGEVRRRYLSAGAWVRQVSIKQTVQNTQQNSQ
jgi:hypothetical protein